MFHRRFDHLTPRYIYNRVALMFDELLHPDHPWLTADSVSILMSLIKPTDVGVEFGSGRSTRWLAKRLQHLTSIENNQVWFKRVQQSLESLPPNKAVDYRLCVSNEDYAGQANTFTDGSIDFCLIDGAVRDLCALSMLPKIRVGGIMVVDNINWYLPNDDTKSPDSLRTSQGCTESWQPFYDEVSKYRRIWTTNGITDTAIWIKI